jgi:multiple sugar transport system permease protein
MSVTSRSASVESVGAIGAPRGRASRNLGTTESLSGLLFVSPWIIGFLAFTILPMAASLLLSFTDFDPRDPGGTTFIGLDNYARMMSDPILIKSLTVTIRFVILIVPTTMIVALAIAMLVNSTVLRGKNVFRTIFYMPVQIPLVASTLIWIGVLNASTGWLNYGLEAVGIPKQDWLNNVDLVHSSLTLMGVWGIGNMMLIFLAGLQGVPTELYDSARVDGAGRWATFRNITLPMISTVIFYNLVISLIGTFQYFTQAYIISNGRGDPDNATLFFNLNLYREAFVFFDMGYASALAWLLFAIVLTLTVFLFRSARSWVYEGGGER